MKLAIQDTAYEQRNMDLFTKIEFDDIMKNLEKDMEEIVKQELTIFYRMSGVMVQMLMFEAENS